MYFMSSCFPVKSFLSKKRTFASTLWIDGNAPAVTCAKPVSSPQLEWLWKFGHFLTGKHEDMKYMKKSRKQKSLIPKLH